MRARVLLPGVVGLALTFTLLALAAPSSVAAIEICPLAPQFLVGYAVVGAHQYDQGDWHGAMAVTQPLWCAGPHWEFGGIGWGNRSQKAFVQLAPPGEMGVAFPGVTYRRGKFVAQLGITVQGSAKYFWYTAVGIEPWRRRRR